MWASEFSNTPERGGMVFVRYKTVKGRRYYQLVRNFRENGTHRQEVICHLGPNNSVDAAIEAERRKIAPVLEYYEAMVSYHRWRLAQAEEELAPHGHVLDEADARRIEAALSGTPDFWESNPWESPQFLHAHYSRGFHEAQRELASYEHLIADRRARLDNLLAAKAKYF
jgi:hypothetical protein